MVIEEKTVEETANETQKYRGICGCVFWLERVSSLNLKIHPLCVSSRIVSILTTELFDFIHTEWKESVLNFSCVIFSSYLLPNFLDFSDAKLLQRI